MLRYPAHGSATSNVLAWSSHSANVESVAEEDAAADADEPPDSTMANNSMTPQFRRASVTKAREHHASLLTQALQSASEGESPDSTPVAAASRRRRSITSQISLASTADLTSDTGMSTPARTNTPSPRLPSIGFAALPMDKHYAASGIQIIGSLPRRSTLTNTANEQAPKPTEAPKDPAVEAIAKKRCISFACTAKPRDEAPKAPAPAPAPAVAQPAQPRKTCIKFACTARPSTQQTPPQKPRLETSKLEESGSLSTVVNKSPSTARKARSPVAPRVRPSPRRSAQSPVATRKTKFITANSKDLQGEICHFHEFASDHPTEEDWIRQEKCIAKARLTMDDLLKKENDIRRLGKEAEEEAEQEEAEEEGEEALDEDDEDDEENGDDEDDEIVEEEDAEEDEQSGYGSDDDFSDGYNTDEEYGFAESDDEENDGLHLWTFNVHQARASDATPVFRPWSLGDHHSDSSTGSRKHIRGKHSQSRLTGRPMTPELPDSTDFVCGTMDEDRPLEEAYLTRLAARKQEKLRIIPQDIDPSFPTSEPEDEDEEDTKHSHGSGDHLWLHGELEELEEERADRRHRRGENASPKRLRSPPPKRLRSPPPKARGRSPRRLFDRSSPKRIKSPAPAHGPKSPRASPTHAEKVMGFKSLASRPGLTHTKSLPRAAYFPAQVKSGKRTRANTVNRDNAHVRGAIDIVKGLEHKRQRRKEKFYQKYCNRARKGQIPEKKAQPGEGAERMRELGLILAGKMGQGNYVISI
ncbi:hypothetical protein J7T55_007844 [Diaporthe amygdali]|uniref:uncharacterized protein n=1 Tax=Phomopsis amygdali TaxID=1214568 RepID=UPI0022FE9CBE|nr:uncharacterized protein J7T55_007844 [Diaporthe amygdali]KAJ0114010.1 hypothetical protein J7T55_007844 [Diaporthe amygdali]